MLKVPKLHREKTKSLPPSTIVPQQILLDKIKLALSDHLNDPLFNEKLAKIKQLFYIRDYKTIFSDKNLLGVYASEYIPHRALCYQSIFSTIVDLNYISNVLTLGAGTGAELCAIASVIPNRILPITVHCQDLSDYGIIDRLSETLNCKSIRLETSISDLLLPGIDVSPIQNASLITAMFLLNELFATSKAGFARFISALVENMSPNSLLLVVDSAGSFSEAKLQENTFMIYKFLDAIQALEIVHAEDAVWFRTPKDLRYPVKLNNMRYFIRLYKKK